jgi:hypothetical protein
VENRARMGKVAASHRVASNRLIVRAGQQCVPSRLPLKCARSTHT